MTDTLSELKKIRVRHEADERASEEGDGVPPLRLLKASIDRGTLLTIVDQLIAERAELREELEATVKKLGCPESVLINMLRGTVARPSAGALPKLYSVEELVDAARFAAAYNEGYND